MNGLNALKGWIGALTEVALMLLALGIVLALLAGPQVPFLGNVVGNIVALDQRPGQERRSGLDRPRRHTLVVLQALDELIPGKPGPTHCRPRVRGRPFGWGHLPHPIVLNRRRMVELASGAGPEHSLNATRIFAPS